MQPLTLDAAPAPLAARPVSYPVELSIIVVNWNTRELVAQCLESLYAHPPEAPFEVLVVDNASTDGSVDLIRRRFDRVRLIENAENIGFARGCNQGMRQSLGRHVLLLNSDTVVLAGALQALLSCLAAHPAAGACGPMLLNADGSFQASYADFPTFRTELLHQLGLARRLVGRTFPSYGPEASRRLRTVDWVGGACILVRRACVEQVGVLDESFVMYGEEVDWCYRMHRRGWIVRYCPTAQIVHLGGQSAARVPIWKYLQIQRGRVRFFRKHYGRGAAWLLAGLIRTSNLLKATLFLPVAGLVGPIGDSGSQHRWRAYWGAAWTSL